MKVSARAWMIIAAGSALKALTPMHSIPSLKITEDERPTRKGLAAREKHRGGLRGQKRGPADFNRKPR